MKNTKKRNLTTLKRKSNLEKRNSILERRYDNGITLSIRALRDGIFHIYASGLDGHQESLLDRYGFIEQLPEQSSAKIKKHSICVGDFVFELTDDGGFCLYQGTTEIVKTLTGTRLATFPTINKNLGWQLDIPIEKDEKIIGFGDQERTRFLLNGQRSELWVRYPVKHVPVPFFMSSRSYGIFFNTTRRLLFDICVADSKKARFVVEKDFFDAYIITGKPYDQMIEKYTRLTGRPKLPPLKSLGLWLLFHSRANGHDVLTIAKSLRDSGIACDNLGLEPAWMQKEYDFSVDKEWNAERFRGCGPTSSYRAGPEHLINALSRMGFSLGLWLCSRWDFTWEEERRIKRTAQKDDITQKQITLDGIELNHFDENIGHGAIYMDENTKHDQAWFEHLKKFVKDGVRFFKVDPAVLINEFPDRLYGNGRKDDEMHNIAFMLCSKQMNLDYEAFTGKRAFGISISGWAGFQRYPGTWAGDTGGGKQSLVGILQDAIVGHSYATCDMNTKEIAGIHMGFLLPWTLINSWSYFHYPSFQGEKIDSIYRDYSRLRMRLLFYLYSLGWKARQTGKAITRPMCLLYPQISKSYEIMNQFFLGDYLLVTSYQDYVILPDGQWFDWWNNNVISGNWNKITLQVPENKGGHLLIREGALIPLAPEMKFVGEKNIDELTWLIFPSNKEQEFTLYCDDGESLQFREGAYASVTLHFIPRKNGFTLKWGKINGKEPWRISQLRHRFEILAISEGLSVESEDGALPFEYNHKLNRCITEYCETGKEIQFKIK